MAAPAAASTPSSEPLVLTWRRQRPDRTPRANHPARGPTDHQLRPEAQDPVDQHRLHRAQPVPTERHERNGDAPLDDAQAARGDGEVGGQLTGAVGKQQALPRDPGPDGREAECEARAVEHPVADPPAENRADVPFRRGVCGHVGEETGHAALNGTKRAAGEAAGHAEQPCGDRPLGTLIEEQRAEHDRYQQDADGHRNQVQAGAVVSGQGQAGRGDEGQGEHTHHDGGDQ